MPFSIVQADEKAKQLPLTVMQMGQPKINPLLQSARTQGPTFFSSSIHVSERGPLSVPQPALKNRISNFSPYLGENIEGPYPVSRAFQELKRRQWVEIPAASLKAT